MGVNQLIELADSVRPPRRAWGTNRLRGRQRILTTGPDGRAAFEDWEPPRRRGRLDVETGLAP